MKMYTSPPMILELLRSRKWEVTAAAVGVSCLLVACGGGGGGSKGSTSTVNPGNGGLTATPNPLPTLPATITTKAQLGQALFFDTTLSNPKGMSCATCHDPTHNFVDPRGLATSQGAVKGLFNFRNAPSIKYMGYSPEFTPGGGYGTAVGGQFWDGHANDLADQAHFPLLNPVEMNNGSATAVVATVQSGKYAKAMQSLYGSSVFASTASAMNAITDSISTFEKISAISPFTSKYDAFLKGQAQLTAAEARGLALFNGQGNCSGCHTSSPSPDGTPPMFTNYCYANVGLPKNPKNPYYTIPKQYNPLGSSFVDLGLQLTTGFASDAGFFMTPSLRNVGVTPPYFHNGLMTNLTDVVNFYNTRDTGAFGPAEVPATMDTTELGNLGLTPQNVSDLVSFLNTLTDGYTS